MALFEWGGLKDKLGLRRQSTPTEVGTGAGVLCENPACKALLMKIDFTENFNVCPRCGHHHPVSARRRIELTLDPDSFVEWNGDLAASDPLGFTGLKNYLSKLEEVRRTTGELDAMVSGEGRLGGRAVAFGATDGQFMKGSMGSVVGEKFVRMVERAIERRLPVVTVSCSGGGARMYEGLFSLMQMAKTSAILARLQEAGLPYLSVCAHETMAGIWASWAALGDVIIAEPGAMIGFTGERVIKATINAELPEGFQRSEFLLEHGQVDMIVPRAKMRERLIYILNHLLGDVA